MQHKKSSEEVEKNKDTWTRNLIHFNKTTTVRGPVPIVEESLSDRNRIPLKTHIVGRFKHLAITTKGRQERLKTISKELSILWSEKLNFPKISEQAILAKVQKTIATYDECTRRKDYSTLNEVFDITKFHGEWLTSEDKDLYRLQIESNGEVGYSLGKLANSKSIHPSKRIAKTTAVTHAVLKKTGELPSHSDTETCSDDSDITEDYKPDYSESPRRKHQKTTFATNLVTGTNVSTSKAAKICRKLSEEGINIPTPSQPAVYKALFKKATQVRRPILNCILRSFDVNINFSYR